ncbi:MAG: hypothetical protein C4520_19030 [Candidatus Abyssobacteria bacterium SURF_5]|uniref:AttH domain-containing protein n=1 Tax=Abyssobacteria bacterium (strain SURF_5) TaxID=2093360 RepID=A0A3A4NGJ8_ABYX5|nr:MAG: hypothetical protein C4520_19030 [Candidatus Abyssubacteria bacterium SURF_5]
MNVRPEDEFIHHDYPRGTTDAWKENWYFNFIDRKNKAWGINHISLERHKQKAHFRAFHVVDDEILMYANQIPLDDNLRELNDGKLSIEFVEPHKTFRLTLHGPNHSLDLMYSARFDVFNYATKKRKQPGGDKKSLAINHYEQALTAEGHLEKDGVSRPISCFGHRDHSWGFRNESNIAGWNWVAAQFPERTINISQVRVAGRRDMNRGFISEKQGNTGIRSVKVISTERNEQKAPQSSVYEAVDEKARVWTLTSRRFSGLFLPLREKGTDLAVHENFSDFSLSETGETGVGIDEYLENLA